MNPSSACLPTPLELARTLPSSDAARSSIARLRNDTAAVVSGTDSRFLLIAGPCSIHDDAAALDYAERLSRLQARAARDVVVCMRVYVEKPRTCTGWKGFVHDPDLDGTGNVASGLLRSRRLMLRVAELGLGVATELLDPILAEYHREFLSWAAIGARTSESQIHRELASDQPFAVGFKNATSGDVTGAVHSVVAASRSHTRFGIGVTGRAELRTSPGNPLCHVVLRGGSTGPNDDAEVVASVAEQLRARGQPRRLMIDCSHGNSGKDYRAQARVFENVCGQVEHGSCVLGAMLESHLSEGAQPVGPRASLRYGQSVTDACIDFETTERLVMKLLEKRQFAPHTATRTSAALAS